MFPIRVALPQLLSGTFLILQQKAFKIIPCHNLKLYIRIRARE